MGDMRWIYHQGAGLWWKARYIVIAELICNVVLNILMAKYLGVLGIILATLISLFFINFIGGAWILFKEYFKNGKLEEFFVDQMLYFVVTAVIAALCFWSCEGINKWLCGPETSVVELAMSTGRTKLFDLFGLGVRLLLCTFVTIAGYYVVYHHTARYQDAKEWVKCRYNLLKYAHN